MRVRPDRVNALLGTESRRSRRSADLLDPIGFDAVPTRAAMLDVRLPSWRPDCDASRSTSIEEVARHYGYDRLGKTVPTSAVPGRLSPRPARAGACVRQVLLGLGLSEAMPNPFLAPGDLDRAGLDRRRRSRIANPLVAEESVLRTSLRPGLLKAVAYNASHRHDRRRAVRDRPRLPPPADGPLPDEREVLGVVLAGREAPAAVAVLQEVVAALGLGDRVQLAAAGATRPARWPGCTRPEQRRDRRRPAASAWSARSTPACSRPTASPGGWRGSSSTSTVLLGPASRRSRSGSRSAATRRATSTSPSSSPTTSRPTTSAPPIARAAGDLLVDLDLFDVYRGPGIPAGQRSLAYRLRLQAADRTLTDAEVAAVRDAIIAAAATKGATLRA